MSSIRALSASLSVAALLVLTACAGNGGTSSADSKPSSGSPASGAAGGGTAGLPENLSVIVQNLPDLLDTRRATTQLAGATLMSTEPLIRFDGKELQPNLASAWEQVDRLTYRFELRPGVKFWDGSALTAEDVIYSMNIHRGKESESQAASQFLDVTSVKKTGPSEVTIRLRKPDPQFAVVVAQTGIVSKAYEEKNAGRVGNPKVLNMGTGPYKFESFEPSKRVALARNDEYWGRKSRFKRLELSNITDDSARLLAVQSGEVDGLLVVPLSQLKTFETIPDIKIDSALDHAIYRFDFDLEKKPWNDPHLQRAFAHTVDAKAIVDGVLGGKAVQASTMTPPSFFETLASPERLKQAYGEYAELVPDVDLDKARAELAKSSTPNGVSVELLVAGSDPNLALIGQVVAQNAAKVGIKIKVRQVDDNTYINAIYFKHTTDGLLLENYSSAVPDASNTIINALSSANTLPDGNGINVSNYKSSEFDALIDKSVQLEVDDPERGELLLQAQQLAAKDMPFVPVAWPEVYVGLKGMAFQDWTPFWWLTNWSDRIVKAG